jgi:hypothetical protein
MHDDDHDEVVSSAVTRRRLIKSAIAGGVIAWAVPAVVSFPKAWADNSSQCTTDGPKEGKGISSTNCGGDTADSCKQKAEQRAASNVGEIFVSCSGDPCIFTDSTGKEVHYSCRNHSTITVVHSGCHPSDAAHPDTCTATVIETVACGC